MQPSGGELKNLCSSSLEAETRNQGGWNRDSERTCEEADTVTHITVDILRPTKAVKLEKGVMVKG